MSIERENIYIYIYIYIYIRGTNGVSTNGVTANSEEQSNSDGSKSSSFVLSLPSSIPLCSSAHTFLIDIQLRF